MSDTETAGSNVIEMTDEGAESKTDVGQMETSTEVQKDAQPVRQRSMSESSNLYGTHLNTNGFIRAITVNNEANEGLSKYANIPEENVNYLDNFKREKVDDKLTYSKDDEIWE